MGSTVAQSLPVIWGEPRKSKTVAFSDVLYVFALLVFIIYHVQLISKNNG